MITYKSCDCNIETIYSVEYVDNQKDMDYINSGKIDAGEPCERYKTKSFKDIDSALSLFMTMFVRDDILALKLFEEIKVAGNTVREQYIEPAITTMYCMKLAVSRSMEEKISNLQRENEQFYEIVSAYRLFIGKYNSEKLFDEYQKKAE